MLLIFSADHTFSCIAAQVHLTAFQRHYIACSCVHFSFISSFLPQAVKELTLKGAALGTAGAIVSGRTHSKLKEGTAGLLTVMEQTAGNSTGRQ